MKVKVRIDGRLRVCVRWAILGDKIQVRDGNQLTGPVHPKTMGSLDVVRPSSRGDVEVDERSKGFASSFASLLSCDHFKPEAQYAELPFWAMQLIWPPSIF